MKSIIHIIIGLFIFIQTAQAQEAVMLSKSKARKIMLNKDKERVWLLVEMYDPYNGGVRNAVDTVLSRQTLMFHKKGTYNWVNQQGSKIFSDEAGKWQVSSDEKQIALSILKRSNQAIAKKDIKPPLYYHIVSAKENELVLSLQGRHGMVEMKFKRLK